jgi:hypothetical protein
MDIHLLYESDVAAVTRKIVRLGDVSYQVANICSVAITERLRLHVVTIVLALAGVVGLALAYTQYSRDAQMTLWAGIAGVAGLAGAIIWQTIWPKREYKLVLTTAAGEAPAFTSHDKDMFRLKAAIEDAFTTRI